MMRKEPGALDGIRDRRSPRELDLDEVLHVRAGPDDGNLHRAGAYTASARRTKASMNVLAMCPNTGPTTFSSRCVVNS